MKKIFLPIFLAAVLLATPVFSQQVLDGTAAIVGDDVVLTSDINALVTQYAFQNKIDIAHQPSLYHQLGKKFLETLIDQKLLLIKAEEDTIKVDDERVEQNLKQQMDYMIQQAGSEQKLEEYYSAPLFKIKKDLRKEIENQMRIGVLRDKRFGSTKISRKEVENFYHQYEDSLPTHKATVSISHILMQVTPSKEAIAAAYQKTKDIRQRLLDGEDFATLAKKYSEDPGSASNGGDLGFVSRGTLVKEFEEAAFSLKKDEISDIVQSQFGFHIIQLLERQGERIHVRHILIQLKPTTEDEQRVVNRLKEIRQKILDGDSTFEEMALKYSSDPNVEKDHGNLGQFEQGSFQIKGFEDAVQGLKPGEISEPFRTEYGYHIVRLDGQTEARPLSLKNDWEQIEQWALQHKQENEFKAWLAQLRKEIPVVVEIDI
jgi:peptidyl-prolyl cis-trans isomerase SurA